ncbi:bifunctional nuclease family protein [Planctomycetota bacterium]
MSKHGSYHAFMVPVELRRLLIDQRRDEHAIYLHEKNGPRGFPIVIGIFEATIIDRILKERKSQRPLTHELLLAILAALGGQLLRIEIDAVEDDCYFAKLRLEQNGREHVIDCRPSDGVALALQLDVPILVDEAILTSVGAAE